MNWVGGVRNRLKAKDDRKRQKDFFEKQKFENKVKRLYNASTPSKKKQAVSLDLVSLQAANFTAANFQKNDTNKKSAGRVTHVDLDKSRGLFGQKFVELPDASPESKPSSLNLNRPSPRIKSINQVANPLSKRRTLQTIEEHKLQTQRRCESLFGSGLKKSQHLRNSSHKWTSTPKNPWHIMGKADKRNTLFPQASSQKPSQSHLMQGGTVKKEPPHHFTSEKLLLHGTSERPITEKQDNTWSSSYMYGRTPGSSTSGFSGISPLSAIEKLDDEAMVPSLESSTWDSTTNYGGNEVLSPIHSQALSLLDQSPSPMPPADLSLHDDAAAVPNDIASSLSSFKDLHKYDRLMYPLDQTFSEGETVHHRSLFHDSHMKPREQFEEKDLDDVMVQPHNVYADRQIQELHDLEDMKAHFIQQSHSSRLTRDHREIGKQHKLPTNIQRMNPDISHHSSGAEMLTQHTEIYHESHTYSDVNPYQDPGQALIADSTQHPNLVLARGRHESITHRNQSTLRNQIQHEHDAHMLQMQMLSSQMDHQREILMDEMQRDGDQAPCTSDHNTKKQIPRTSVLECTSSSTLPQQPSDFHDKRDLTCHESTMSTSPEDNKDEQYPMMRYPKLTKEPSNFNNLDYDASSTNQRLAQGPRCSSALSNGIQPSFPTQYTCEQKEEFHGSCGQKHQQSTVNREFAAGDKLHLDKNCKTLDVMHLNSNQCIQTSANGQAPETAVAIEQRCSTTCTDSQSPVAQLPSRASPRTVGHEDCSYKDRDMDDGSSVSTSDSDDDIAESSSSSDDEESTQASTDEDDDMAPILHPCASSSQNWLGFVQGSTSQSQIPVQTRNATQDTQPAMDEDDRGKYPTTVPTTAQQLLNEVLKLDAQIHKESTVPDIGVTEGLRFSIPTVETKRSPEMMSYSEPQCSIEEHVSQVSAIQSTQLCRGEPKQVNIASLIGHNETPGDEISDVSNASKLGITREDLNSLEKQGESMDSIVMVTGNSTSPQPAWGTRMGCVADMGTQTDPRSPTPSTETTSQEASNPAPQPCLAATREMTSCAIQTEISSLLGDDIIKAPDGESPHDASAAPSPSIPTSTSKEVDQVSLGGGGTVNAVCDGGAQCMLIGEPLFHSTSRVSSTSHPPESPGRSLAEEKGNPSDSCADVSSQEFDSCVSTP